MRRRFLLFSVLVVLVLAVGAVLYLRSGKKPSPGFETVAVDRGRIVARLMAAGTLSPLVTVQVGSQVSGRIKALLVDFNSPVKKGQVIARIDPQIFNAAVEQAQANLLAAEANLAKARVQAGEAERQHRRARALAARKLVAEAEEETARANSESAQAQIRAAQAAQAQARASLNQTRINLAYTTIVSPIDGVVISRNVDVGQTVAASLQAPTLFSIAEDLAKMQVHANVAESDIGRIREEMQITFSVDAYPREHFPGVVRQIRNAPQTVQNVVTYDVVVDVENRDLRLKPGMTANVSFVWAETGEVLRLQNAVLRFRPPPELQAGARAGAGSRSPEEKPSRKPGGRSATRPVSGATRPALERHGSSAPADRRQVWVLRDGAPRPVSIRIGISDSTMTEIVEGPLREGDELIVDVLGAARGGPAGPARKGMPGPGGGGGHGRGVVRHL